MLYISRANIPHEFKHKVKFFKKHLSVISFRPESLIKFGKSKRSETEKVEDIELVASKPDLNIGGSKIKDSSFVFEEGVVANLVSTSKKLKNASFTMQAGKDTANFASGTIKKSTIDTGAGSDDVIIGAGARLKKTSFDLGVGKDKVTIEGEVIKAALDMGDDAQKDKIINLNIMLNHKID